ncbi:transglutaminase family protein [Paraconexibacter sp.]|uniref:transglutaminase-like domain-containing protein n=1 Tax=Paraconexibacter sp. TaxID=2949640 RepID=UPI003561EB7A
MRGDADLPLLVGCEFVVETSQPTVAIMQVAPAPDPRVRLDIEQWETHSDHHSYVDHYGNRCERLTIPVGVSRLAYRSELCLSRPDDVIAPDAREVPIDELPDEVLAYVLPSRFVLPDELGQEAWDLFGSLPSGWSRVQAIVDHVHGHLEWVSGASNPWTTAVDANRAGQGVCRDFAHLAITYCRALNIPARYAFGYLPAVDVPPPAEGMDFAAWFEVYLADGWHTFDARNNEPRSGRVVVGRGRDATDVALLTSFGPVTLTNFSVTAEERPSS